MHVTIETAGTRVLPGVACHLMSLSPKLSNSTPVGDPRDPGGVWAGRHEARRLDPGVLRELIASSPDVQLKFVVASAGDLAEIDELLAALPRVAPSDVMLMPEGVTTPEPGAVRWVVEACPRAGGRTARGCTSRSSATRAGPEQSGRGSARSRREAVMSSSRVHAAFTLVGCGCGDDRPRLTCESDPMHLNFSNVKAEASSASRTRVALRFSFGTSTRSSSRTVIASCRNARSSWPSSSKSAAPEARPASTGALWFGDAPV